MIRFSPRLFVWTLIAVGLLWSYSTIASWVLFFMSQGRATVGFPYLQWWQYFFWYWGDFRPRPWMQIIASGVFGAIPLLLGIRLWLTRRLTINIPRNTNAFGDADEMRLSKARQVFRNGGLR